MPIMCNSGPNLLVHPFFRRIDPLSTLISLMEHVKYFIELDTKCTSSDDIHISHALVCRICYSTPDPRGWTLNVDYYELGLNKSRFTAQRADLGGKLHCLQLRIVLVLFGNKSHLSCSLGFSISMPTTILPANELLIN